jgi:glycosyltransferase involved in cell wall biosynthesis
MNSSELKDLSISIVIPTKNRPERLFALCASICNQTLLPGRVVIVDQSSKSEVKKVDILALFEAAAVLCDYIHDCRISGLVEARNYSMRYLRSSEVVIFLDDDLILDQYFVESAQNEFLNRPNLIGISGVDLMSKPSFIHLMFFNLTHFGYFSDYRLGFNYFHNILRKNFVKNCNIMLGGMTAWRTEVIQKVNFLDFREFHFIEDFALTKEVLHFYPKALLLFSTDMKAHHYHQYPDKFSQEIVTYKKTKEYVEYWNKFSKKHKIGKIDYLILMLGLFIDSLYKSIYHQNVKIFKSFSKALKTN